MAETTRGTAARAGLRRRRLVCAATVLVGAVVLALSLRIAPGDPLFYPATFALAGVWVAGALASGPLRLGRMPGRVSGEMGPRPVLRPIAIGLVLAGIFVLGALVAREIPFLADRIRDVTDFAVEGAWWLVILVTLVNGFAEEVFFRGALFEAVPARPILVTTSINAAVVAASGNLALTLAAVVLGLVVGWGRRVTGGLLAPVLTHVTWSLVMLLVLPLLLG